MGAACPFQKASFRVIEEVVGEVERKTPLLVGDGWAGGWGPLYATLTQPVSLSPFPVRRTGRAMPTEEEKPAAESAVSNAQPIGKRKRKQKRKLAAARAAKSPTKKTKASANVEEEVRKGAWGRAVSGCDVCEGEGTRAGVGMVQSRKAWVVCWFVHYFLLALIPNAVHLSNSLDPYTHPTLYLLNPPFTHSHRNNSSRRERRQPRSTCSSGHCGYVSPYVSCLSLSWHVRRVLFWRSACLLFAQPGLCGRRVGGFLHALISRNRGCMSERQKSEGITGEWGGHVMLYA